MRGADARFVNRTPTPILALRFGFFVVVAMMIIFGVGPFSDTVAKRGVFGSAVGLCMIGLLYAILYRHYVRTGRAIIDRTSTEDRKP